jgi:lipopolysaccharide assembly outer membrane protein LptD (OstA)
LNENNYRNDINQVSTDLKFDRFSLSSDYLLLRRSQQNLLKVEQLTLRSSLKLADKWFATILLNRDLELKRTISRSIALKRDGCCTIFGLTVTETNLGSLIKPQRSFSINFTFKNL